MEYSLSARPLRVYLAGAWAHRGRIAACADQLRAGGHVITYEWFVKSEGLDRRTDALRDLIGVRECDVFVALADDPAYQYRGTATELGIALGLQKPIYMVLPPQSVESDIRKNVFVDAPGVMQLASWQDALRVLGVLGRDGHAPVPRPKRQRLAPPQSDAVIETILRRVIVAAQHEAGFAQFDNGFFELALQSPEKSAELVIYTALYEFLQKWARTARIVYAGLSEKELAPCECVACTRAQNAATIAQAEVRSCPTTPLGARHGVTGAMGAGKTTIVTHRLAKRPSVELAFATPLYRTLHFAQEGLGLPRVKDRAFLQKVGTEWGRALSPDVWERLCMSDVTRATAAGLDVYVSDMRFPNEHAALRAFGARCVRVTRPRTEAEMAARAGSGTTTHASETALAGVAMETIVNDGTLAELYAKVDALFDGAETPA